MAGPLVTTVLHIGMPKTGTTSLQRNVFARHEQLHYVGQTNAFTDPDAEIILRSMLDTEPDGEAIRRQQAADALDRIRSTDRTLIISDEAFGAGAFMARAQTWRIPANHRAVADRAHAALGQVEVMVVLRNQMDWLVSWHRQGLTSKKYVEPNIDRWLSDSFADRADELFSLIDYRALHRDYAAVFGADHVHVFLYEEYRDRFGDLASEMAEIAGVDADAARRLGETPAQNVSGTGYRGIPEPMWRILRSAPIAKLASIAPSPIKKRIGSALSSEIDFGDGPTEALREQISARFAAGNRELFEQLGLPNGAQHGYFSA